MATHIGQEYVVGKVLHQSKIKVLPTQMHLVGGAEYVRQSMLITKGDDKIELIKPLVFDILGKLLRTSLY